MWARLWLIAWLFTGTRFLAFAAPASPDEPSSPTGNAVEGPLEEVSPLIERIELKRSPVSIEVFIAGVAHTACYDTRDIEVVKKENSTLIIPRLKRSHPFTSCKIGLSRFNEKIADLDPLSASSRLVSVLGFRGWHHRLIDELEGY
jgi:hypothetical protein